MRPSEFTKLVNTYVSAINTQYKTGIAREHSYRGHLETLIRSYLPEGLSIVNEPSRMDCGAPDYLISKGNIPLAFIEAKDLNDPDLMGQNRNKEQFDRYKNFASSIVFTDYLDFHLYKDNTLVTTVRIAKIENNSVVGIKANYESFRNLLDVFITTNHQKITSPDALARLMAQKARFLSKTVENCFQMDKDNVVDSEWYRLLGLFRHTLISDLKEADFADMYAQTIAYGLFVARLNDPTSDDFSRFEACNLIPEANPFLRKFFQTVSGYDLDKRVEWIVDDLAHLFLQVDIDKLKESYKERNASDPFYHFYELFLSEYDANLRKSKGVWYTPQPVVSFIVKSVDKLLQTEFGLPLGLADYSKITVKEKTNIVDNRTKDGVKKVDAEYHRVQILDPATGSGTFLVEIINRIYDRFKNQKGMWQSYVSEHLLDRLNAFEIMIAPYVIAHLKVSNTLTETGFDFKKLVQKKRQNIFLTNSLEPYHESVGELFLATELNKEAREANNIKEKMPIMVVVGNPPYNGTSQNKNLFIDGLMIDYKQEPNQSGKTGEITLQETQSKWLNDDYVKFIRLAQEFVTRHEGQDGLIGFITAHGFIDNPTFRGMRYNLLQTFDKIYILNLHGNSTKKEVCPDGSKDENVFDIKQGVAITFFVKNNQKPKNSFGKVFYADLWGKREDKYGFLANRHFEDVEYVETKPIAENGYCFDKVEEKYRSTWSSYCSIADIFKQFKSGFIAQRDKLCIRYSYNEMVEIVKDFARLKVEEARTKYQLGEDARDWKVSDAINDVLNHCLSDGSVDLSYIKKVSYRPFDDRYTYHTESRGFMGQPQYDILKYMYDASNVAILTSRQSGEAKEAPWTTVFITNKATDFHMFRRASSIVFPMYQIADDGTRLENIKEEFLKQVERATSLKHGERFSSLDVMDYIYAILNSNIYRTTYKHFLDSEYPRIPLPKDKEYFETLVIYGAKLRQLHLMKDVHNLVVNIGYPIDGNNIVDKRRYKDGNVYINTTQYFDNVPENVWNFCIGGYQVLDKWLKDRKGTELKFDDIAHFQRIVAIIEETIKTVEKLDSIIEL